MEKTEDKITDRQDIGITPGPWKWWTSCSFRRLSSEATGKDGDVLCGTIQRSDNHPDIHLRNGGYDGPDGRAIELVPEMVGVLQSIDSHYRGSLDYQPYYVAAARAILEKISSV